VIAPDLLAALGAALAIGAAAEVLRPGAGGGGRPGQRLLAVRLPAAAAARFLATSERLRRSGLADRLPIGLVLAGKGGGALAGALIALVASPAAPGRLAWLVGPGLPLAGFMAPDALLERAARRRARRLLAALPDALDLLAVSASSGRSAGAGLAEVAGGGAGPLARELKVTVAELDCGASQAEALASLRRRVPGTEVAKLCATLDRSRRLGSPLADQLRRQAGSLRRDQSRLVAEHAARAAPKIQLVVALVLVPSVLLMIVAGLAANADRLLGGF
jgi:tight adherence protein C